MKVLCFLPDSIAFQNKLGMVTRAAGVNFQPCNNEEEAKIFATNEKIEPFFLFADARKIDFLKEFSFSFPRSILIVILYESLQKSIPDLVSCTNIQCFVATTNGEFDARELLLLLNKYQTKEFPDLLKHLSFPAIFNERTITNPNQKKEALTSLEGFVLKIGDHSSRSQHYANRVCELADQLIVNSVFEANPRLINKPPNEPFTLDENEVVSLKWGYDGEVFGLSVKDSFGTLTKNNVLKQISTSYKINILKKCINSHLGIRLIFNRLHHYIVNVDPGKMTEVICLMRFEKRFKDFENRLRSFHYFQMEERF